MFRYCMSKKSFPFDVVYRAGVNNKCQLSTEGLEYVHFSILHGFSGDYCVLDIQKVDLRFMISDKTSLTPMIFI